MNAVAPLTRAGVINYLFFMFGIQKMLGYYIEPQFTLKKIFDYIVETAIASEITFDTYFEIDQVEHDFIREIFTEPEEQHDAPDIQLLRQISDLDENFDIVDQYSSYPVRNYNIKKYRQDQFLIYLDTIMKTLYFGEYTHGRTNNLAIKANIMFYKLMIVYQMEFKSSRFHKTKSARNTKPLKS